MRHAIREKREKQAKGIVLGGAGMPSVVDRVAALLSQLVPGREPNASGRERVPLAGWALDP
jgi:Asp/Glu/hydantoin racemase